MSDTEPKLNGYPVTGIYAGPNTVLAIDYNGHAVMGVQCSDELQDGSAYMMLLDQHMQVTIATVLASSIRTLQAGDVIPPPILIADREDYASTRKNLEELARQLLATPPESTDDLRAAAIVLSDLADVIDGQETGIKPHTYLFRMNNKFENIQEMGARAAQAAGQALHEDKSSTAEVGSASLADGTEVQP